MFIKILEVYDFLKQYPSSVYFSNANFNTSHFGPGWAWDDYNDYYSTERSPLPVYGNIFWVESDGKNSVVEPKIFRTFMKEVGPKRSRPKVEREIQNNDYRFYAGRKPDTLDIPYHVDADFIAAMLSDTLHRNVITISNTSTSPRILYTAFHRIVCTK